MRTTTETELIPSYIVPLFVRSAPICVLHVDDAPPLSPRLLDLFARHPRAVVARVDPTTIESTASVTAWINARQKALGWPPSASFPDGYYLFIDGEARAYHPATLTDDDVRGFVLGGVVSLVGAATKHRDLILAGNVVADYDITERVIETFAAVLLPEDSARLNALLVTSAPEVNDGDDVALAFAHLGLSPSATRAEVTRRHRDLTGALHPQRLGTGAEVTRQLDDALSLIRARRAWS